MTPPNVLNLADCDTGESKMNVVRVPEGFSLQLYSAAAEKREHEGDGWPVEYRSIILSPRDAVLLSSFLASPAASPVVPDEGEAEKIVERVHCALVADVYKDSFDNAKNVTERKAVERALIAAGVVRVIGLVPVEDVDHG